jgi:DNA-binding MarR family transcriptional regulator
MFLAVERVKHTLRYCGPCTFAELLEDTGLNQTEVSAALGDLIRMGRVKVGGVSEDIDTFEIEND